jgi:ParB-like chromosome segregation protein Spo0J
MVTTAPTLDDTGRHADTEEWLDGLGIAWTFKPGLYLGAVDREASLANQARLLPLDLEVVERYAADYERGDRFPPLLAYAPGRDQHRSVVLIGGNHRLGGAEKAGRTTHDVYLLDIDDAQVLPLAYADNRRHGLAPSDEERVLQAAHLIDARGISQGEAAAIVGLSIGKLSRGIATIRADDRAAELGLDAWPTLSKSVRWRLSALVSDVVFEAAARLAIFSEMGADDIYSLVRQLQAAGNEDDALHIVGEAEEEQSARRAGTGSRRARSSPRMRMLEALRVIAGLDVGAVVAGCETDDHRQVLRANILAAAQVMGSVEMRVR